MKRVEEAVLRYLDEDELVRLTRELIRIKSVYRPGSTDGNEEKAARFVADYLRNMGLQVHYEEVVPGRPNVIALLDFRRPGKTLLYEAHTDVVTEGDPAAWRYDPFGAVMENGRIYGRGGVRYERESGGGHLRRPCHPKVGGSFGGKDHPVHPLRRGRDDDRD